MDCRANDDDVHIPPAPNDTRNLINATRKSKDHTHQAGSSRTAYNLYSAGFRFGSWPEHLLLLPRSFVVFILPGKKKGLSSQLGHDCFFLFPFLFTIQQSSYQWTRHRKLTALLKIASQYNKSENHGVTCSCGKCKIK